MFLKCLFFIIRLKYFHAGESFFDTLREKHPNMEFFPVFGLNTP